MEPETATAQDPRLRQKGSLIDVLAEAIAPPRQIPDEVRERMLRHGYMRIDTGIIRSDRYAMLDQVSDVSGARVDLSVSRDDLIDPR